MPKAEAYLQFGPCSSRECTGLHGRLSAQLSQKGNGTMYLFSGEIKINALPNMQAIPFSINKLRKLPNQHLDIFFLNQSFINYMQEHGEIWFRACRSCLLVICTCCASRVKVVHCQPQLLAPLQLLQESSIALIGLQGDSKVLSKKYVLIPFQDAWEQDMAKNFQSVRVFQQCGRSPTRFSRLCEQFGAYHFRIWGS